MYIKKDGPECEIELKHGERIKLFVPASKGKTWIRLRVTRSGKLQIIGGTTIIEAINNE